VRANSGDSKDNSVPTVGVADVTLKPISRQLTVSSELVPFQEIDVYAKQSGYVRALNVDYGSRVKAGDILAVLEIPELEMKLAQDKAAVERAAEQATLAEHQLAQAKAQHTVANLQFKRLKGVAETRPGLVAEQEVDDAQGKDLASEAQVQAAQSAFIAAQSLFDEAKAQQQQDRVLFDYSKIVAPFAGVVTQRYANFGALMQAGTNSSTQAMPLVRLSQDDLFRLVIPVPEAYVKFIKVGDPVQVRVPSLSKTLLGKVTRFSVDVASETRTMHTEVDVQNPSRTLMPGLYAEATLTLDRRENALVVPLQAVNRKGNEASVLLVTANNLLVRRPITLGLETAGDAEVLSGLNQGDRVVVSDRSGLKAGAEVRPQTVDVLQYDGENSE
jgi:RND family efflux transporter MFP subunit